MIYKIIFLSEEKCEQIEALNYEVEEMRKQHNKVKAENAELQQKAALADVYSDEMESLREKVNINFIWINFSLILNYSFKVYQSGKIWKWHD